MIIAVTCPSCAHKYDVPGKRAGRRVRCAKCATTFRVPVPMHAEPEPEASVKPRRSRLADLFESSELAPTSVELAPRKGRGGRPSAGRVVAACVAVAVLAGASGPLIGRGLTPWVAVILLSVLGGSVVSWALTSPRDRG